MFKKILLSLILWQASLLQAAKPGLFAACWQSCCPCFGKSRKPYDMAYNSSEYDKHVVKKFIRISVHEEDKKLSCFAKLKRRLGFR